MQRQSVKPSLIPLQQWYCDSCGEIIQEPEHGYLEWRDRIVGGRYLKYGFRVVHQTGHTPYKEQRRNCYYSWTERAGDLCLPSFLGSEGIARLTSWIDGGEDINEIPLGPTVADMREWTLLFRRLHLPYFEEARRYLAKALREDYDDCNEVYLYMPDTLKKIIVEHARGS